MPLRIPREVIGQFRNRRNLLWLCQRYELRSGEPCHELGEDPELLRGRYRQELTPLDLRIASLYWEAIWSDSVAGLVARAVKQELDRSVDQPVGTIRRPLVMAADPDEEGQLDTRELLPLYFPFGLLDSSEAEGRYTSARSLRRQGHRYSALRKLQDYPNRVLVILGAEGQVDLDAPLATVSDFAPVGLSVLIIWPVSETEPNIPESMQVPVHVLRGSIEEFLDRLENAQVPRADFVARVQLRVRDYSLSLDEPDLFGITDRFNLILEADLAPLDPNRVNRAVLEEFLKGTEGDWRGYAAGLPVARAYSALSSEEITLTQFLLRELKNLESRKESANLTATIPAANGSGVTTLLRATAFEVARAGYPVLLLKHDQIGFNSDGLAAFLNRVSQKCESRLRIHESVPALIVFDADHEYIGEVYGVAQALSAQGRPAIVLRAEGVSTDMLRSTGGGADTGAGRVHGRAIRLCQLSNVVEPEEMMSIQAHFTGLARQHPLLNLEAPSLEDWAQFQNAQVFVTPDGSQAAESLFWVALHFFLFSRDEPPEGFDEWIRRTFEAIPRGKLREAVRRVAALSSFRLVTPLTPLMRSLGGTKSIDLKLIKALAELDEKSGLISWDSRPEDLEDQVLRFRHPLLAQKLLFCTDPSLAAFPVEIIWPVIESLKAGRKADVWLGETIAFQILRTKRSTAEIPHLDKRLETFRRIPPQVSLFSKAILHHWARALYHCALSLVEHDAQASDLRLLEAIDYMDQAIRLPVRPGRDEHPSHLYTSLGSMYFEWYKRKTLRGEEQSGDNDWSKAAECFDKALALIGDNYEALAAYAQRLVERAQKLPVGSATATQEALKALAFLDQAEEVADQPGELRSQDSAFLHIQRNKAWGVINPERAERDIVRMIEERQEVGYLIRARQLIQDVDLLSPDRYGLESIHQAIVVMDGALGQMSSAPSWRFLYLLSRLNSAHPEHRFDFDRRLEILQRLERTDFKWHIRMRFEHAVLCYQGKDPVGGQRRFKQIRALLRQPDQPAKRLYDFWRRRDDPLKPRETTLAVRVIDSDWRGYGYVDELDQEVIFRPRHFEVQPRVGEYRRCIIRFETNGPMAVPTSFPVHPRVGTW